MVRNNIHTSVSVIYGKVLKARNTLDKLIDAKHGKEGFTHTQQTHTVGTMPYQRRCYVSISHRRPYDIVLPFCVSWYTVIEFIHD